MGRTFKAFVLIEGKTIRNKEFDDICAEVERAHPGASRTGAIGSWHWFVGKATTDTNIVAEAIVQNDGHLWAYRMVK